MRERHELHIAIKTDSGITPAYAGKTKGSPRLKAIRQDHPRVCGKDPFGICLFRFWRGSPPRMRERRRDTGTEPELKGITPAYAGKTYPPSRQATIGKDHPRVCGKDPRTWARGPWKRGSPPRMRERLSTCLLPSSTPGITPAYAGKTETHKI